MKELSRLQTENERLAEKVWPLSLLDCHRVLYSCGWLTSVHISVLPSSASLSSANVLLLITVDQAQSTIPRSWLVSPSAEKLQCVHTVLVI